MATLIASSAPYVTAALTAYGAAVLARVQDDAADATANLGRRLLQRVFGRRQPGEALPAALAGAVQAPGDPGTLDALRLAIGRELQDDAAMLADVRELLAAKRPVVHAPTIHSGGNTYYAGRDMTVDHTRGPSGER
ncbi:hypothetical protein ACEZCY_05815 [Streptacidiphilus sp. N1-12]|uniref:Uncharacterized protein n=2 Tax=Streptacidiphilus alkalitolerans TaxID=3342712 RepID=A0ABV6XAZ7_9ACTN